MKRNGIATIFAVALTAGLLLASCNLGGDGDGVPDYEKYLYMTDTTNGRVYTFDPSTELGTSLSLVTTSTNAAGEIKFYRGIGYVAMGFGGVWSFDPSASNPVAALLSESGTLNAQYFAFYSPTKAYVTVAANWASNTGALYSFNPSDLAAGVTQVPAVTKYAQEAIVGADNMLYVAQDRLSGEVLKINPVTDSVVSTYTTGVAGTTGLAWGTYDENEGVFVASTSGSIKFIIEGAASGAADPVTSTSIFPARVIQLSNGNLVATGYDSGYINRTYMVALSGTTATVTELKDSSDNPFGSLDIASKDGLVYVPDYYSSMTNNLYVFDESGVQQSYSPVSVMTSGDGISNIGFYE